MIIACPQADFKGERELSRIIRKLSINSGAHQAKASDRELKEKNIYPRMTQMDTDGCPQADV